MTLVADLLARDAVSDVEELPVGVALVGFGYWGANHARNMSASPLVHLVGVFDVHPERRAAAVGALAGARTWTSYRRLLADPDVEAVVIATPAATHAVLALEAIAAGRHVLVEKPLAMDPAGAEAVAVAADEAGVVAMVGHTFLYSPPVNLLRQYVLDGRLGRIRHLSSQRLSLGRVRKDCDALWNLAPHDISILLHLLGEVPSEVSARGFSFLQAGIDDVCTASLAFPSGAGADLRVSWLDPQRTRMLTVVGDRRMAVYDDTSSDQKIRVFDAGAGPDGRTHNGEVVIPPVPANEPLLLELEDFARASRLGGDVVAHARHGVEVVRVLDAISRSARAGGAPMEVMR